MAPLCMAAGLDSEKLPPFDISFDSCKPWA
jgi:hypothetical protein